MSTIYICDGCQKEMGFNDLVRFWGSRNLSDLTSCESCFEIIEKYVIEKFKIESKTVYEQS